MSKAVVESTDLRGVSYGGISRTFGKWKNNRNQYRLYFTWLRKTRRKINEIRSKNYERGELEKYEK